MNSWYVSYHLLISTRLLQLLQLKLSTRYFDCYCYCYWSSTPSTSNSHDNFSPTIAFNPIKITHLYYSAQYFIEIAIAFYWIFASLCWSFEDMEILSLTSFRENSFVTIINGIIYLMIGVGKGWLENWHYFVMLWMFVYFNYS